MARLLGTVASKACVSSPLCTFNTPTVPQNPCLFSVSLGEGISRSKPFISVVIRWLYFDGQPLEPGHRTTTGEMYP